MEHELIARYIYAVTRHLPAKMRADVEKELDSLISDMLEERCGAVLPTEKDVRIVLTELGTPESLAAKYSGDENRSLISGSYLLLYKRVLKIALPVLAAVILFASILALFADGVRIENPYLFIGKFFGTTVGGAFTGMVHAFAVITIIFAILERKKTEFSSLHDGEIMGDMFSKLPQLPKEEARIKIHDPIMGIVWGVIFTVLFLVFPWFAGVWLEGVGWIPVFVTEAVRALWLPIILWGVFGIVKESARLLEGR